MAESAVRPPLISESPAVPWRTSRVHGTVLSGPFPFVVGDVLSIIVAAFVAHGFAPSILSGAGQQTAASPSLAATTAFATIGFLGLAVAGAYRAPVLAAPAREWPRIVGGMSFAYAAFGLATLLVAPESYDAATYLAMWASAAVAAIAVRVVTGQGLCALRSRGWGRKPVLVIGDPDSAGHALQRLQRKGSHYAVAAVVDARYLAPAPDGAPRSEAAAAVKAMSDALRAVPGMEVLITAPLASYPSISQTVQTYAPPGTTVRVALYPTLSPVAGKAVDLVEGVPTVRLPTRVFPAQYEVLKRALDIILASILLVFAGPLMAAIALAVKLDSPGSILFKQTRIGRYGRTFKMYKFRSMKSNAEDLRKELLEYNEASGPMFKLRSDPRITRVGGIIRKLSLDELPQLFNVLNGSMSLVGPRPPLPDEVKVYQPWQHRRLDAVPGITGLWQVSRGKELVFEEMVQLDLQYIERWSLWMDLWIMLKTVPTVLTGRGAY